MNWSRRKARISPARTIASLGRWSGNNVVVVNSETAEPISMLKGLPLKIWPILRHRARRRLGCSAGSVYFDILCLSYGLPTHSSKYLIQLIRFLADNITQENLEASAGTASVHQYDFVY
ncbi:hypothetical protein K438DRAFT_1941456 [Mycena galopus ATCC 62051]|nr:hypothetical protein K438DRAFT_1941456 [Mycena galopus ATCC 62051]